MYVNHLHFIAKSYALTVLKTIVLSAYIFDNKCCTFQSVFSNIKIQLLKERCYKFKEIERTLFQTLLLHRWFLSCPSLASAIIIIIVIVIIVNVVVIIVIIISIIIIITIITTIIIIIIIIIIQELI